MTPTTLSIDLTPAFHVFLRTLAAAQLRGESVPTLTQLRETSLSRLDQQWETLEQLAREGLADALAAPGYLVARVGYQGSPGCAAALSR